MELESAHVRAARDAGARQRDRISCATPPVRGVKLTTGQDLDKPKATYIEADNRVAEWLQQRTGGIAQSGMLEAPANIPITAHILGGAVIGRDADAGVVDGGGRVINYRNLPVCDGSILPANPGVNPSLTITALAEMMVAAVPAQPA